MHVSLGMYGSLSHFQSIDQALKRPLVDPLLGMLSTNILQLCPQNRGRLDEAMAQDLREMYPEIQWRLHANVWLQDKLRRVDLCDWPIEQAWFARCAQVSHVFGAKAYTAHAGKREACTVAEVLNHVRGVEQHFGIPVGIEGHYPTPGNTWLISSWEEYRQMFDTGVRYALDLSHLNILAKQSGRIEWGLVQDMLASPQCLEVHVSENDGSGDQHLPLTAIPWWFSLLDHTHLDAVIFSEGRRPARLT